jgi:hypothetical protein
MAASFASTKRKSTRLPVLPGVTIAGTGTPVSLAPVTANAADAVSVPLTAVTVTTRFDLSAPVEMVAASVPVAFVLSPGTEKFALPSTENVTGTAATTCPPSEVVVAVAVTVLAPVLEMLVVLSASTILVATKVPGVVGVVGVVDGPGSEGTKPELPEEPPPPPHAAKTDNSSNEAKGLSMFISKSIGLSAPALRDQRAAERSVTTLGVRKISSSVLLSVRDLVLNKLPR